MATNKGKKSTTSTRAAKPKGGKISFHKPGEKPADVTIKTGTTFDEFVAERNLVGFDVYVNGNKVSGSTVLNKGDNVRVGVKTKNAS